MFDNKETQDEVVKETLEILTTFFQDISEIVSENARKSVEENKTDSAKFEAEVSIKVLLAQLKMSAAMNKLGGIENLMKTVSKDVS